MGDVNATTTAGVDARGYRRAASGTGPWDQYVVPVTDRIVSYRGRAATFRIPGLAGTTGQNLMSWHNATGSTIIVDIDHLHVDHYETVAKVLTSAPPIIRVHRVTVLPSGGAALGKVPEDTALSSSSSLTMLQGASADGTGASLTATIASASTITQEISPRLFTAAGVEVADRIEFLQSGAITLRPLEGLVMRLDYVAAVSNPVTDMWVAGGRWEEYTRP